MKINNIIILNSWTLGRFFDFKEFWDKRHEFVKSMNTAIFFNPANPDGRRMYDVVKAWINKTLDPAKGSVSDIDVRYGLLSARRIKTAGCDDFLNLLSQEDRIGVTCLYEMIGRSMKTDVADIASTLRTDFVDWSADVVKVPQSGTVTAPDSDDGASPGAPLRNVMICNVNHDVTAYITAGDEIIRLRPGECCRAVFRGIACLGLLPDKVKIGEHEYSMRLSEGGKSVLLHNGTAVSGTDSVASYSINPRYPQRYVYVNDKGRIISADRNIDDFDINTSLPKTEKPLHVIISDAGNLYIITSGSKTYVYNGNSGLRILSPDDKSALSPYDQKLISKILNSTH